MAYLVPESKWKAAKRVIDAARILKAKSEQKGFYEDDPVYRIPKENYQNLEQALKDFEAVCNQQEPKR